MHQDEETPARRDPDVESLQLQLKAALDERNEFWADAQRTRALEHELVHARRIIAEMTSSPSWRVTTPLRGSKQRVRGLKRFSRRMRKALRGD